MVASSHTVSALSVSDNYVIRNRSNSPHTSSHCLQRKPMTTENRTTILRSNLGQNQNQNEVHDTLSPAKSLSSTIPPKYDNCNYCSSSLRRFRSDNIAQSSRNNPNSRRSIFGHYFQDKTRSHSAPHSVRRRGSLPLPTPSLVMLAQQETKEQQTKTKAHTGVQLITRNQSFQRSSSTTTSLSASEIEHHYPKSKITVDICQDDRRNCSRHYDHRPIDYRLFAPSEEQIATSAICNRFQELNKRHEHYYELLLERKVVIEQSLPPFPSPLRRFCSETTTTIAGVAARFDLSTYIITSSSSLLSTSNKQNWSFPTSTENGEMHHYCGGVYSLLTPVSILRPGKYNKTGKCFGGIDHTNSNRSIKNRAVANNLLSSTPEVTPSLNLHQALKPIHLTTNSAGTSVSAIFTGEEKKENDRDEDKSGSDYFNDAVASDDTTTKEEEQKENQENQQHLRFDPRVTVTEFDDTTRKWYTESELNQLKREAMALAQLYLKQHPMVAKRYQTAKLDLITKTYRKRALFSLPVFSSLYPNNVKQDSKTLKAYRSPSNIMLRPLSDSSSLEHDEELIKRILIVDPHPKIASLLCKSMNSMFPSAEVKTSFSAENAMQIINQSSQTRNRNEMFDVIVIEQSLAPASQNQNINRSKFGLFFNSIDKGPFGLIDILMKNEQEESKSSCGGKFASPPTSSEQLIDGSKLVELILNSMKQQDHQRDRQSSPSPCLMIGVSFQPDRDATKMRRAGADFVWGKPIPTVGDSLRNEIVSKLLAKRSSFGNC